MVPRTLYTLQPLWPSTAFRTPASLELRDIPKSHLLRLSFPPSNHVVGCVILGPGSDASPIPILTNCRLHAPYRACALRCFALFELHSLVRPSHSFIHSSTHSLTHLLTTHGNGGGNRCFLLTRGRRRTTTRNHDRKISSECAIITLF